jgi:O-antigen/teichoic acid export membrane protein
LGADTGDVPVPPGRSYEPRKLLRNFRAAFLGEAASKGAAFLATIVVARSLSSADFGRFSFVVALVSVGLFISDFGLQIAATRSIAADRRRAAEYVTGSILIGGTFALACYLVLVGIASLGLFPDGVTGPIAIFGTVLLFAGVINAYWSLLRGFERQDLVYLAYAISSLALLAGIAVAGLQGASVEVIFVIYVATFGLRLMLTGLLVKLKTGKLAWWRVDRRRTWTLAKSTQSAALAYLLQNFYSHIDVILLGFLVSAESVGFYAQAYKLVDAVTFLAAGALTAAVFPVFSRLLHESPGEISPLYNRVTRLMTAALVVVSILLIGLAYPLVRVIYGSGTAEAGHLLMLLAPSAALISINFTTTYLVLAVRRDRLAILSAGLAAAINVALNLIAVPYFGVGAAALATFLAEVTMVVAFQFFLTRVGFHSETLRGVSIGLGLIAVPFALALAFPSLRVEIGLLSAALALVAVRVTRLVRGEDVAALKRLLLPRRPLSSSNA